jgi:Protein of unknown function (DUF2009)
VLQSLHLWAAIVEDMFRLWCLAEADMLSETQPYELKQTGQGLQRVQQSPRVYRSMHELLAHTKARLGSWIGSSVIHLGDHNVPNALLFIDKYTQVSAAFLFLLCRPVSDHCCAFVRRSLEYSLH